MSAARSKLTNMAAACDAPERGERQRRGEKRARRCESESGGHVNEAEAAAAAASAHTATPACALKSGNGMQLHN